MLMAMYYLDHHAPIRTHTRSRIVTTPTIIMIMIMIMIICIAMVTKQQSMEAIKNIYQFQVIAETIHALVIMAIIIIITTVVMRGSIMVSVMIMKTNTAFRALSIMMLPPTAMTMVNIMIKLGTLVMKMLHLFVKSMTIAISVSYTHLTLPTNREV